VYCLVYPAPAAPQPLPAASAQDGSGKLLAAGDEDFAGLRNYVAGDALPRIAWKAFAREQGLQVKQFSAYQGQELWLDWRSCPTSRASANWSCWYAGYWMPTDRACCMACACGYSDRTATQPVAPGGMPAHLGAVRVEANMKLSAPLVYGLIACILLVSAPHAEYLPLWVSILCSTILGWRFYLAFSGNPLPPRWLLLGITAASVAGILLSYHTLFGREAGVTLLILLAALKLLELRAARDATVLIFLGSFIIITNFFNSQSIPTALYMLFTLLVILTTWVHLHTGMLALSPRLRIAAILLLQAVPLTLLLFVLFRAYRGRCGVCRRMPIPAAALVTPWRLAL